MEKEELKKEHCCSCNCDNQQENIEKENHECCCGDECQCEENCKCQEEPIDEFDESEEVLILKNNIQNLWEVAKAVLRRNFIAPNACVGREQHQINDLSFHFKKLEE